MKKIIKILIVIILLTINNNVNAKVDDTMLITSKYSDVFAIQEYKTGGRRMYIGQIYHLTKGSKTEIGYCIDLGTKLDALTYSSTSDYTNFNLSKNQADYIKLVAYYGYSYNNHYDRYYYFAAQEIIWEYLTKDEIYWVDAEDYNANRINLESYKNEIIELVNKHNIYPSFNNQNIDYGQTITLTDNNGVLNDYKVVEIKNATYSINNNNLRIKSNNLNDVEISLARNINKTNDEMFYYANGSQSIVSTGMVDNNLVKYNFKNNGISLKINKRDFETGEYIINSNVGFKIYDLNNSNYISDKEFVVAEEGYVIIPNMQKNNYRIEEVDLGMNEYLYNDEPLDFFLDESNIIYDEEHGYVYNIDFYNKKPSGTITINKKGEEFVVEEDSYHYEQINLSDTSFDIITLQELIYNDEYYKENEIIANIITDENGIAIIENLPLGKYIIKEKEVDSNYEKDPNEYEINIEYIDPYTNMINKNIEIKNYLKKTTLEITKIDSQTNNPLEGVQIAIYDSNNKKIYEGKTNQEGKIIINDLVYGLYYVKEITQLNGYINDDTKYEVKLDENKNQLTIKNDKIPMPPKTGNGQKSLLFLLLIISLCINQIKVCYN